MACIKAFLHSGSTSILWICLLCPLVSCAIFLEAGPQNKTVVEGDKVTLVCDVNNDNINTIYWTYLIGLGGRRYISRNDYIYPCIGYDVDPANYKVIIDQSQQTYKLVIMTINLSTEAGIYECVYEKGSGRIYTKLASAMISVIIESYNASSHSSRENRSIPIAPTVIISVIIIFFIFIFVVNISFPRNKRKSKRKMNRKVKRVRTNLSEESPSNILNVIQTRATNGGEHSGIGAQRSGELSLAISSDSHPYSNNIYRSDNRSFSTVLESELNKEPNCDCQTRLKESCQIETDLKEVIQKATHLEMQSFEPFYETMRDEVFTCEVKPKTSVHNRLMTSSSRPDEKQHKLKDTEVEQKTSNSSSSAAHWIVDPVDLHSRPLPRCPQNPNAAQYLYDHPPSAGAVAKDEVHRYGEINTVPSLSHIASQGFGIENKSEGGTGKSSEAKENAVQTAFAENVLNDENIDCSGVIRTSLRSSRMDAMVISEQCNEKSLEMKAKSDDPSHLDNCYLLDIQSPVFDLTPMCRHDP